VTTGLATALRILTTDHTDSTDKKIREICEIRGQKISLSNQRALVAERPELSHAGPVT
jgi:hypothetical protein